MSGEARALIVDRNGTPVGVGHVETVATSGLAPSTDWGRRVAIGYAALLLTSIPAAAAYGLTRPDPAPAPVSNVVSQMCNNGHVTQSIDLGRPDGMLLARSTDEKC